MKKNSTAGVHRRKFLKAGGVGALSILAGCSSGNGNERSDRSGSGENKGDSGNGGGRNNGVRTRRARSGGPPGITFGYLGPLSSDIGIAGYRGAQIAAGDINMNGGVMGYPAAVVKVDTQGDPSKALTAVSRLVEQKGVDMLVGTFSSEVTLAVEDKVAKTGTPFIVTGAASPKVSTAKMGKNYEEYKNVYRVSPVNSDYQAQALTEYGTLLEEQHGWTKFAVVAEDALWTKPITDNLPAGLEDNGLTVTMTERFPTDTSDFRPLLDRVKRSGADVLLKAIGHVPATGLLSTWQQKQYPFAQEGINISSMSPQYWNDTNGGCLYETTSGPSGVASITSKSKPFTKEYIKYARGRPTLPMSMGVGTYDGVSVGANAIAAGGSLEKIKRNTGIVSYWLAKTNMKGASGHIEFFGKNGKYPNDVKYGPNKVPFVVNQWQTPTDGNGLAGTDGTKVAVWPKKYATGNHVAPPWL